MAQKQRGFTLVELMVVVSIIAILAMISIPFYRDHVIRSQVAELLTVGSACTRNVALYYDTHGALPTDEDEAGCSPDATMLAMAPTVLNGVVSLDAAGPLANKLENGKRTLVFAPLGSSGVALSGGVPIWGWDCTSAFGTSIEKKYLPSQCR